MLICILLVRQIKILFPIENDPFALKDWNCNSNNISVIWCYFVSMQHIPVCNKVLSIPAEFHSRWAEAILASVNVPARVNNCLIVFASMPNLTNWQLHRHIAAIVDARWHRHPDRVTSTPPQSVFATSHVDLRIDGSKSLKMWWKRP